MPRTLRLILLTVTMLAVPAMSFGAVSVSITIAPPALPVYSQPICPGAGYIWTPGYWAYGAYGYYWVPGTWVLAPFIGALWTPGYWGWDNGAYLWNEGYWGPQVGFYGGINYGFGYVGVGYAGGYWNNGSFYYNSVVNNVNRTVIHNVYRKPIVSNAAMNGVSYNGGRGGTTARPSGAEVAAARDRHSGPTTAQAQLRRSADRNPAQRASVNHGRPSIVSTAKAGTFSGPATARTNQAVRHPSVANSQVRGTGNRAAGTIRTAPSEHTSRQPANHQVARQAPKSAPPSRSTARANAQVSRNKTPAASRYSARNSPTARPAVSHAPAVAQHAAPRANPQTRHTAPPSHRSAQNKPEPRPAASHTAAVAQHAAPRANPQTRHTAPPPHRSAQNKPEPRPAASRAPAVAQHAAPRANPPTRHTAPPSHPSAQNKPEPRPAASRPHTVARASEPRGLPAQSR